jgi:excisionase family DNA binding protein
MSPAISEHQTITATTEDHADLLKLEDLLAHLQPEAITLQLVGRSGEAIALPLPVFNLLHQMVQELLQGNSVTITPIHKELTTQEAADILNVSRQYLVELLEAQAIPYIKVGTHRRIRFGDLMNYKADRDAKRRTGLSQMTKTSQKMGLQNKAANSPFINGDDHH